MVGTILLDGLFPVAAQSAVGETSMINVKSIALAAALAIGLGGAAMAQVTSGSYAGGQRGVPPGGTMQNGAPLSNGQTVEPGRRPNQFNRAGMRRRPMMRSRAAMRHRAHMRQRAGMHHRARMHHRGMRRPM